MQISDLRQRVEVVKYSALDIEKANALNPLSDLVRQYGAELDRSGGTLKSLCPFHDEKTPSFVIFDDGRAKCFGCGWAGDTIDFYREITGLHFNEAMADLLGDSVKKPRLSDPIPVKSISRAEDERKTAFARQIWREAQTVILPGEGALVGRYALARGITIPLPSTLREHPALKHAATGMEFPAMLGLISRHPETNLQGIHRTYLRMDGEAKAPVSNAKMMLGNCAGGAVRLAPQIGETLVLTEGIETGLTVLQETGLPVWACLSTSGMRSVIVPDEISEIVIAADNDPPGIQAAKVTALRLATSGKSVKIIHPDRDGTDFNDRLSEVDHGS